MVALPDLEERLERIERKLDEILAILKGGGEASVSGEVLEELNWRSYPSGEGEWIFADEAPASLLRTLSERGSVTISGYRYTLREGRTKRFVARKKVE
ncbi:MAG TPA: hypothetical protein ENF82_01185 [Candidatus Methanomethylia archaeon]|nr:hypothetical protein [Candidatus Methanomethylicia archaeon]